MWLPNVGFKKKVIKFVIMTKEKAIKFLQQLYPNGWHCWLDEQRIEAIGMAINALQKELASEDLEKVVEEIVGPTVLNAYGVKEIANRLRRTIIESVSEEQVKESLISKHENKTCKENGDYLTQEPVSEDLKEAYESYTDERLTLLRPDIADMSCDRETKISFDVFDGSEVEVAFYEGANWQKQKDESKVLTEEQCRKIRDDAFELGKDAMKQKMMKDAVIAEYWDNSLMLDAEMRVKYSDGEEVKVIIIKED